MKQPALITEKTQDLAIRPILVVDKKGFIGDTLVAELISDGTVVYVTEKSVIKGERESDNIVYIPFLKRVPTIPENNYSYIFIVDDKGILRESIMSFLKKAQRDNAVLVFITDLFKANKKLIEEIRNNYKNSKIIIHGDIFEFFIENEKNSSVNQLIYDAKKYGRIELPGNGTKLLYPISKKNLTKNILEAIFGSHQDEQVFCLFPKEGITYLSFAHLIQRVNPWLKIDFVKEKKDDFIKLPFEEGSFAIVKHLSLSEDIKDINFKEEQIIHNKSLIKKNKKIFFRKQKTKKQPFLVVFLFISLLLLMPAIATFSLGFLGATLLQSAKNNFSKGNLSFALDQAKLSQKTFILASRSIKPLRYELALIKKQDYITAFSDNIETGVNISEATIAFLNASSSFTKVIEGKAKAPENEFIAGVNSTKNAIATLQKEVNKKTPLGGVDERMEKTLNFISSTIDLWPALAGFDGKKNYLVLLQNNMELRPGGGFIGSYGLLTVDKGKFSEFQINDVYNADGQLKAHIEPPTFLRKYLLVKHLFLRDSNFDLDFRRVASQAAVIFNLETGSKINGVIGVDISVMKNILNSTGEVTIPDYKEKVNADNLFYITESHVEKGFFPGSTQKKDFLRSLYNAIFAKLFKEKNISYLSLLDEVAKSIEEKHLLFGFSNTSAQNLFTVNGWSSAVWDVRKESAEKINDFLGVSEANLGGNKVNYFVSRSISQKVSISKDKGVKEELTITYKNNSDGAWPGGDYKNYLRLILPQGAVMEEIRIDNKKQKIITSVTDPAVYEKIGYTSNGLEVEQTQDFEKIIYGFLVIVPKEKLVRIDVFYSLPNKIKNNSSSLTYNLKLFKQPGVDSFPYSLVVEQPDDYRVLRKPTEMVNQKGIQRFETNVVKDENLSISFTKNN